jgi:nucleoside triphosphate diphosphatase
MQHTNYLLEIMARLRDPKTGCPWDKEQDFHTIAPYTIEEAYEVAEAIAHDDMRMLKAELGDLLFQVVFYAQMAGERGLFDFEDIAEAVCKKMVRRHPHVFGDEHIPTAQDQTENWEKIKRAERAAEGQSSELSFMDDIPHALPALMRAEKIQKRAVQVGFDWPDGDKDAGALDKIAEEFEEVKEAHVLGDKLHLEEELGDLLFAVVNLTRRNGINAEHALRAANRKFERRFRHMEGQLLAQGKSVDAMKEMDLAGLDALWSEAKAQERKNHAA